MVIKNAASDKHYKQMEKLALFAEADSIEYTDNDKSELYVLKKGNKTLVLTIAGNQYDGGFLCVS